MATVRHIEVSKALPGASLAIAMLALHGCALFGGGDKPPPAPPRVYVFAPVLNLTGADDFDALVMSDLIASELASFENASVIPVNLALAELARRGMEAVETPQDAVELARTFGADGTIVVAVTEYSPYDPPVVGLVLQYYPVRVAAADRWRVDPVTASRSVTTPDAGLSADVEGVPVWQIQRVFNAADEELLEDVKSFASKRDGAESPYGWRRWIKSQDLYVRYCGHALIRTMNSLLNADDRAAPGPYEAAS